MNGLHNLGLITTPQVEELCSADNVVIRYVHFCFKIKYQIFICYAFISVASNFKMPIRMKALLFIQVLAI